MHPTGKFKTKQLPSNSQN